MMRHFWNFAIVLASLIFTRSVNAFEYQFIPIDIPGAISSQSLDINNHGQIVGNFTDANGGHGFLLNGGNLTLIDYPDGSPTFPRGINNDGVIVGHRFVEISEGILTLSGFVYDEGRFADLNVPGVARTGLRDINDHGRIVGGFADSPGFGGPEDGFIYDGDAFTPVSFPGASNTIVNGINNDGEMVGDYGLLASRGYVLDADEFTMIDVVLGGFQSDVTIPSAINGHGVIVGSHNASLLDGYFQGFVYDGDEYHSIHVPGALETFVEGINDLGDIVGTYRDMDGNSLAFVARPIPEPPAIGLAAISIACILVVNLNLHRS